MAKPYTNDISEISPQTPTYTPENRKNGSTNYDQISEPFTVPGSPDPDGKYRVVLDYAINGAATVSVSCGGTPMVNVVYGKALSDSHVGIGYEGIPVLEFTEAKAAQMGICTYTPLGSYRDSAWENKVESQLEAVTNKAYNHTHSASAITSGTLADARLSSNVPLKNAFNTFASTQTMPALALSDQYTSIVNISTASAKIIDFDFTNNSTANLQIRYGRGATSNTGSFTSEWWDGNAVKGLVTILNHKTYALTHYGALAVPNATSGSSCISFGSNSKLFDDGATIQLIGRNYYALGSNAAKLYLNADVGRIGFNNGSLEIYCYGNESNPSAVFHHNATPANRSVSLCSRVYIGSTPTAITSGAGLQVSNAAAIWGSITQHNGYYHSITTVTDTTFNVTTNHSWVVLDCDAIALGIDAYLPDASTCPGFKVMISAKDSGMAYLASIQSFDGIQEIIWGGSRATSIPVSEQTRILISNGSYWFAL